MECSTVTRGKSENSLPGAERVRFFRQRQAQDGLVRIEASVPQETRDALQAVSQSLGKDGAKVGTSQVASALLHLGLATYQQSLAQTGGPGELAFAPQGAAAPLQEPHEGVSMFLGQSMQAYASHAPQPLLNAVLRALPGDAHAQESHTPEAQAETPTAPKEAS